MSAGRDIICKDLLDDLVKQHSKQLKVCSLAVSIIPDAAVCARVSCMRRVQVYYVVDKKSSWYWKGGENAHAVGWP